MDVCECITFTTIHVIRLSGTFNAHINKYFLSASIYFTAVNYGFLVQNRMHLRLYNIFICKHLFHCSEVLLRCSEQHAHAHICDVSDLSF